MFTIEINGKGIAVVDADEDQARALAEDDDFLADLRSMTSNGEPLWNGSDALVIRIASDDEVDIVEATDDEDEDEEDDEDGVMIVFIPPIDEDDEGDVGDEEERRA